MVNVRRGVASGIGMAALMTSAVLAPAAVAQDSSVSGTVTLWYLEDPEFTFLPALKAEFEAAYPGTTVELTEIPEDGFVTKVDTAILAGQPPDVAFVYEPRWIKAGAVMPLDEVIAEKGVKAKSALIGEIAKTVADGNYDQINRFWEATPSDIAESAVDELGNFMLHPDTAAQVEKNLQGIADKYASSFK